MKILIVDDMVSIRSVLKEILSPLGAKIYEAENGQDAIEKVIKTKFDVVLMDIEMPIINGLDVLKQLRQVHGFRHLPIIMMTGLTDESLISKAFENGAYDYVRKPINASEVLARIRSVLERQRVDKEMFLAKKQAEHSNLAKSEFVSHMAHELKTPLNAINGFAELLKSSEPITEEQKEYILYIIQAAQHQQKLIDESLDLAKIEAGIVDVSIESLPLADVIKDSFTITTPLAEQFNVNLIRPKRSEAEINIEADKKRLTQVLLNLISNAIKYNEEGGDVNLIIRRLPGNRIRIGVVDTGIGISEQKMPHIFESFNRIGAEDSDIEGTGIGLSITKKMIELMGGTLDIESTLGQGSTFWVELNETFH